MHGNIAKGPSGKAEKPSEKSEIVSEKSEAMRLLRIASDPCPPGEHVQGTIRRVANLLGWKEGRTGDVWYGEARVIRSGEMDKLRSFERRKDARALKSDYAKHRGQLVALREQLETSDPDFHRGHIDAITFALDELKQSLQR